jgi:hypothetical protein
MDTHVNKITKKTQKQVRGWCNKHENKQLEGLHEEPTQMELSRWEGQNFSEVVVPQEEVAVEIAIVCGVSATDMKTQYLTFI